MSKNPLEYASINNADAQQIRKVRTAIQGKSVEFVALEKVHGSNFSFETDGDEIRYFSRAAELGKRDTFVRKTPVEDAMRRYHEAVYRAFRLHSEVAARPVQSMRIYGEYFGGWYPAPLAVAQGAGVGQSVQGHDTIAYAPDHHFYAFEVRVDGVYLDFDAAISLLQRSEFPLVAEPIRRGNFDDCIELDVDSFRTRIPTLLRLPPCDDHYSIAEGIVVRPNVRQPATNWFLKKKSWRYLEHCPNEWEKWMKEFISSPDKQRFKGLYLVFCTRPRLDSVLSKDPQLREDAGSSLPRVLELFKQDLLEALEQKRAASNADFSVVPPAYFDAAWEEAAARVAQWHLAAAIVQLPPTMPLEVTPSIEGAASTLSPADIASHRPDNGGGLGVFELLGSFHSSETWGSEGSALSAEIGELVVIDDWDEQGWANALSLKDGRRGWLPLAFCRLQDGRAVQAWFGETWHFARLESIGLDGDCVQVSWQKITLPRLHVVPAVNTASAQEDGCVCGGFGIFELRASFQSTESWGSRGAALTVEAGERVVIEEWDEQGWAKARSLRGKQWGWLPLNFCRLEVAHSVRARFLTRWLPAKLHSVDVQGDSVEVTWETTIVPRLDVIPAARV